MKQEGEINSSSSEAISSNGALITFIGFRPHLCEGFISTINPGFKIQSIYLFESEFKSFNNNIEKLNEYEVEIKNVKEQCKRRFPDANILDITVKSIWSMNDIFPMMSKIKEKRAVLNISAGPSPFIAVCIFWALKMKTVNLAHVIEVRDRENKVESFSYKIFNPIPFLNYCFELDELDREILNILGNGKTRTRDVLDSINKKRSTKDRITLKTVENRVNKMVELGLLEKFLGKSNILNIRDDILVISGSINNMYV
ncbi:MAG: hypothetical protein AAE983_05325 [Thermoplasmataceae archaeon]